MTYHDRLASTSARERWQASACAIILLAVNVSVCARLFLVGSRVYPTWSPYRDDTPHLLALAMLTPTILLLVRAIQPGLRRYFAGAAAAIQPKGYQRSLWIAASSSPRSYNEVSTRHAIANGRPVSIHRDGRALMWIQTGCDGNCAVDLNYDGGWALRLCRWISAIASAILFIMFLIPARREAGVL
jgi:hypothetical protein